MKLQLWMKAFILTTLAVLVFAAIRIWYGYQPLLDDVSAFAGFYSAFGVLYGIMAGFILVTVWGQYNEVASSIQSEARTLRNIYTLLDMFKDESASQKAKDKLKEYAKAAAKEWDSLIHGKENKQATEVFNALLNTIRLFDASNLDHRDTIIFDDFTTELRVLSTTRASRISASKIRIPPTSWILILFLSFFMVASEYFLGVVNNIIAYIMIIAIAGSVSLVVTIVKDLDNPFKGEWNVSPRAFEDIASLT